MSLLYNTSGTQAITNGASAQALQSASLANNGSFWVSSPDFLVATFGVTSGGSFSNGVTWNFEFYSGFGGFDPLVCKYFQAHYGNGLVTRTMKIPLQAVCVRCYAVADAGGTSRTVSWDISLYSGGTAGPLEDDRLDQILAALYRPFPDNT